MQGGKKGGKLAIGITANSSNGRTVEETQVPEISGVARDLQPELLPEPAQSYRSGPFRTGFPFRVPDYGLAPDLLLPLRPCPQSNNPTLVHLQVPGSKEPEPPSITIKIWSPSMTSLEILFAKCMGFCFVLLYIGFNIKVT